MHSDGENLAKTPHGGEKSAKMPCDWATFAHTLWWVKVHLHAMWWGGLPSHALWSGLRASSNCADIRAKKTREVHEAVLVRFHCCQSGIGHAGCSPRRALHLRAVDILKMADSLQRARVFPRIYMLNQTPPPLCPVRTNPLLEPSAHQATPPLLMRLVRTTPHCVPLARETPAPWRVVHAKPPVCLVWANPPAFA